MLRKFVGLYGSQPIPRNRASRFKGDVLRLGGVSGNHWKINGKSQEFTGSLEKPKKIIGEVWENRWKNMGKS